MHQLKGGYSTTDRRLDRIPQHDPRNRAYPVVGADLAAKPLRSYTWSCGIYLDQGSEGACVGHAVAHELAARPKVVDYDVCDEARWSIYYGAQKIDPWEGGAYPGASPFYEGTSVLAGMQTARTMGFYSGYEWAFSEHDLALAVGYRGPAVIGVNWYTGMFNTDADGFIAPTGNIAGGHAILCHSISVKGEYYRVHNSWSARWGVNGTAKIRRADMARLLAEDGDAAIPVRSA